MHSVTEIRASSSSSKACEGDWQITKKWTLVLFWKTDFIWDLQLLVIILYARGKHVLEERFHWAFWFGTVKTEGQAKLASIWHQINHFETNWINHSIHIIFNISTVYRVLSFTKMRFNLALLPILDAWFNQLQQILHHPVQSTLKQTRFNRYIY